METINPCSQLLIWFESEWDSKSDIYIGFSSALHLQCEHILFSSKKLPWIPRHFTTVLPPPLVSLANSQDADPPPIPLLNAPRRQVVSFEQVNNPSPPHRDGRARKPNHINCMSCSVLTPMWIPLKRYFLTRGRNKLLTRNIRERSASNCVADTYIFQIFQKKFFNIIRLTW